jgi:TIR domain/Caspase domain
MTDVFLSYSREDRAFAQRLAENLKEKGISVWWDWDLIGGANYREKIRDVIGESKKAIVLWSRHSVASGFVIDEANEAKKLGKLIPVLIDRSEPPFGFGDLHTIVLRESEDDVEALVAAIQDRSPPRARPIPRSRFSGRIAAALAVLCVAGIGSAFWWYLHKEGTAPPGRRLALVIGNSGYKALPEVSNAIRDAVRVAAEFENRGFDVIKKLDATKEAMVKAVTDFETSLAITGGTGVFYYAGSAAFVDGEDIMLPIDASKDRANSKIVNGVNLTQLMHEVESRTTRTMKDNGMTTIYSASKGEFAADGPVNGDSPFTLAFLRALSSADDELSDTFRKISSTMESAPKAEPSLPRGDYAAPQKQTPWQEGSLRVKFYFGRQDKDSRTGVSKILIFDSCRDNPFKQSVVTR